MKSRAFRALMSAKTYGECGPLTQAESEDLGLAMDLQLLTPDSDIQPGGTIRLSLLGESLLSQLSDVAILREPDDQPPAPAPGM